MLLSFFFIVQLSTTLAQIGSVKTEQPAKEGPYKQLRNGCIETTKIIDVQMMQKKRFWVRELVNDGISRFMPYGETPDDLCSKHGELYWRFSQNSTLWAVQMFDSWSSVPSGLTLGNSYSFGNFDLCVSINVPDYNLKGRYMIAAIEFRPSKETYSTFDSDISDIFCYPKPNSSQWEAFKPTNDKRISKKNIMYLGVCVPDSCEPKHVTTSLEKAFSTIKQDGIEFKFSVNKNTSYSRRDTEDYPIIFYIFICVTVMFVITAVIATIEHKKCGRRDPDWSNSLLSHFSLLTNAKELVKPGGKEFPTIYGLKCLSMFIIIFGHRMMATLFGPIINKEDMELALGQLLHNYYINGAIVNNTFLTISGFLTFDKILRDLNNDKGFSFFRHIYMRWLRFTPTYVYVLIIFNVVVPLMEGGPLSRGLVWETYDCSESWWTHLLYINNYVMPSKQCLLPAWYMAADMQLHIFSAFIALMLVKNRRYGFIALGVSFFASLCVPVVQVITKHYPGVTLFYYRSFQELFRDPEFQEMYMQAHSRAISYIVGMIAAYIYSRIKNSKFELSYNVMFTSTFVMIILLKATLLISYVFFEPGQPFNLWEHVAYGVMHKVIWSFCICFFIIAGSVKHFKLFRVILEFNIFEVFNKLNLSTLLVHQVIQMVLIGQLRSHPMFAHFSMIWMGVGDIGVSYSVGLLIYLLIESPLASLQNHYLKPTVNAHKIKKEENVNESKKEASL